MSPRRMKLLKHQKVGVDNTATYPFGRGGAGCRGICDRASSRLGPSGVEPRTAPASRDPCRQRAGTGDTLRTRTLKSIQF